MLIQEFLKDLYGKFMKVTRNNSLWLLQGDATLMSSFGEIPDCVLVKLQIMIVIEDKTPCLLWETVNTR